MRLIPRRLTVLGTAASLLFGLSPCAGDSADKTDLATISMMIPLLASQATQGAPAAGGEIQKAVEQFTGKKLEITWVPNSDYNERTNITLASDHVPEVMVVQGKLPAFVQS